MENYQSHEIINYSNNNNFLLLEDVGIMTSN